MTAASRCCLTPTLMQCLGICYRGGCDELGPTWYFVTGAAGGPSALDPIPSCGSIPPAPLPRNGLPASGGPFPFSGRCLGGLFLVACASALLEERSVEAIP